MVKKMPIQTSGLTILPASDVDAVLDTLDPEVALFSQAAVFTSFSRPSPPPPTSSSPAAAPSVPGVQIPHRLAVQAEDMTMLFMPARAASEGGTACKIVSVPSGGEAEGLPASTVVMDEKTGRVKAVVNARKLTALRNACGSALSIRALPLPRPPTNLLIFGSGAQAQAHATLFLKLFPTLTTVIIIIRRPSPRSASLLTSLTHAFPSINFTIGISTYPSTTTADIPPELIIDLSQAVHNANIILTLTPSTRPLFNSVDVTSGTHLVLVGSYKPEMREVDEQLIRRAGVVVVDSKEACGKEAGELISAGVEADGMVELGELLVQGDDGEAAKAKVRSSGDVNVFKSVGLGIQDVAIAGLVLREAQRLGLGTIVPNFD